MSDQPSDQISKLRLVYITALLSLLGFVLEIGPVAGVFPQVLAALMLELPTLGFLPYLALAASAAVGLHLGEDEPKPKEPPKPEQPAIQAPEGEMAGERVRVRPDLHQLRMLFTAMGGFVLLKALNLAMMWPHAGGQYNLVLAFEFGFLFTTLGWFVMWQFLRWYAQRRKWVRLQQELVGGDVTRVIAVVILIKPIIYFIYTFGIQRLLPNRPQVILDILLYLAVVAGAVVLWNARPLSFRRTLIGLFIVGALIVVLTVLRALLERAGLV